MHRAQEGLLSRSGSKAQSFVSPAPASGSRNIQKTEVLCRAGASSDPAGVPSPLTPTKTNQRPTIHIQSVCSDPEQRPRATTRLFVPE